MKKYVIQELVTRTIVATAQCTPSGVIQSLNAAKPVQDVFQTVRKAEYHTGGKERIERGRLKLETALSVQERPLSIWELADELSRRDMGELRLYVGKEVRE